MQVRRTPFVAVLDGNLYAMCCGVGGITGGAHWQDVEKYDPHADSWSIVEGLKLPYYVVPYLCRCGDTLLPSGKSL